MYKYLFIVFFLSISQEYIAISPEGFIAINLTLVFLIIFFNATNALNNIFVYIRIHEMWKYFMEYFKIYSVVQQILQQNKILFLIICFIKQKKKWSLVEWLLISNTKNKELVNLNGVFRLESLMAILKQIFVNKQIQFLF